MDGSGDETGAPRTGRGADRPPVESVEERLEADVDVAAHALSEGRARGEGLEEMRALRQRLLNASDRLRRFREERE